MLARSAVFVFGGAAKAVGFKNSRALRKLHFWRRFGENMQIGQNGGVDAGRAQRLKSTSYSSVLKIWLILSKTSAVRWSIRLLMLQKSADGFWY